VAGLADAATDRVSIAQAPALTAWSVCAWVKPAASASFQPIVRVEAGGGTAMVFGMKGLTPSLYSAASTTGINGTAQSIGTYVFMAAVRNGTTATLYWGTNPGSLSSVSGTVNSSGTPDTWTVFGRSPSDGSEWFSGTVDYLRTWGATMLTAGEVAAEAASATAVKAGTWGNWPFGDNGSGGVSLNDVSGNARHLTAGSTPLTLVSDVSLGPIAGALSMGTTAAVSLGAFATRAAALTVATTAQLAASPVRTTAASLPIAITAQVSTGAFADRAAALSVAATAQLSTAPVRDTPAALSVGSTASLALPPVRTTAAALAIDTTSQLDLVPLADRTAALGVASVAQLQLDAASDRGAALAVATAIRLDLAPVLERAGALSIACQASVQLIPGGAVPAALAIAATALLSLAPGRTTPAALDVATAAAVLLSSAVEHPAALTVAAQAQLDLSTERQLASALAIAAVARLGLVVEGRATGSLLLQVGEGRPVRWLQPTDPEPVVMAAAGPASTVSWLGSGNPTPA